MEKQKFKENTRAVLLVGIKDAYTILICLPVFISNINAY